MLIKYLNFLRELEPKSTFLNAKTSFLVVFLLILGQVPASASPINTSINKYRVAYGSQVIITGSGLQDVDRYIVTNNFTPGIRTWSYTFSSINIISDTQVALALPTSNQLASYGTDGLDIQIGVQSASQGSPAFQWWPLDLQMFELQPYDGASGRVWCSIEGFATITEKTVVSNNSCQGEVVIPNGVTSIGHNAFSGNSQITKVFMPNSLTVIGDQSFLGTSGLTEVIFSSTLISIGYQAFAGSTSLTEVTFPNSLNSIGNQAFYQATGLISITFGSGVVSIGDYAFYDNSNLTTVNLGSSLQTIGEHAFNSAKITSLAIPNSVTSIGTQAFVNNTELTTLSIGSGLTEIGVGVFLNATKLKSVRIPNNIETISAQSFANTYALETLTVGSAVTEIQSQAFLSASEIRSLTLGVNLRSIAIDAFDITSLSCLTNRSLLDSTTLTLSGINFTEPIPTCSVVPTAPTLTSVTGGDKKLIVAFIAGDDGGDAVIDYEYSLNGGGFTSSGKVLSPIEITGLAGRTNYSVVIKAKNAVGVSGVSNALTARTIDSSLDDLESRTAAENARKTAVASSQSDARLIAYRNQVAFSLVSSLQILLKEIESILISILDTTNKIYAVIQKNPKLFN